MISFTTTRPHNANWTPSELIYKYAKEKGYKYANTPLFTKYIEIGGKYTYDHYTIKRIGETDEITIFLKML